MEKLILSQNKLNEMEKQTGKASYNTLVHYYGNVILCNNIMQLDPDLFNNIEVGNITEDTEIYQAYITDYTASEVDYYKQLTQDNNDIIIAYSELLDNYILLVDHLGTSWSYVNTDIGLEVI